MFLLTNCYDEFYHNKRLLYMHFSFKATFSLGFMMLYTFILIWLIAHY